MPASRPTCLLRGNGLQEYLSTVPVGRDPIPDRSNRGPAKRHEGSSDPPASWGLKCEGVRSLIPAPALSTNHRRAVANSTALVGCEWRKIRPYIERKSGDLIVAVDFSLVCGYSSHVSDHQEYDSSSCPPSSAFSLVLWSRADGGFRFRELVTFCLIFLFGAGRHLFAPSDQAVMANPCACLFGFQAVCRCWLTTVVASVAYPATKRDKKVLGNHSRDQAKGISSSSTIQRCLMLATLTTLPLEGYISTALRWGNPESDFRAWSSSHEIGRVSRLCLRM